MDAKQTMTQYNVGDVLTGDELRALAAEGCHLVGREWTERNKWEIKVNWGWSGPPASVAIGRIAEAVDSGHVKVTVEAIPPGQIVLDVQGEDPWLRMILDLPMEDADQKEPGGV